MSADYAFRVVGRLTPMVVGALDSLEVSTAATETVLVGHVNDRAELHGLIARFEALGLELIELHRVPQRSGDGNHTHGCPSCGHGGHGAQADRAASS